jgi:GT2 family glycosyltransferase
MKFDHKKIIPATSPAGKDQAAPELSVCIVGHNHRDDLDRALGSVYAYASSYNPEVIVVDNNSIDGSAAMVEEKYPQVHLIRSRVNQGYAPGMNLALAQSRGEFVLTLSHDAELKPGAAQNMMEFLRSHPKAGLVGPRTLDSQGNIVTTLHHPNLLLHVWLGIIPLRSWLRRQDYLRRLLTKAFPNSSGLTSDYDVTHRVTVADGGCLMTRRIVLEKVGLLDPAIPFGPDDYDWCFRVGQAGFEIWYVAESEIIHKTKVKDDMNNLFPGYLRLKFPQLCYLYGKNHRGLKLYFFYFSAFLGNLLLQKSARQYFGPESKQLLALKEAGSLILHPSRYLCEINRLVSGYS